MTSTIPRVADRRFRADFPPGTVVFLIGICAIVLYTNLS